MRHGKLYEPKKLIKKLVELVGNNEYVRMEFKESSPDEGYIEFDTRTKKKYRFKLTYPYTSPDTYFDAAMIETVAVLAYKDGGFVDGGFSTRRNNNCI